MGLAQGSKRDYFVLAMQLGLGRLELGNGNERAASGSRLGFVGLGADPVRWKGSVATWEWEKGNE